MTSFPRRGSTDPPRSPLGDDDPETTNSGIEPDLGAFTHVTRPTVKPSSPRVVSALSASRSKADGGPSEDVADNDGRVQNGPGVTVVSGIVISYRREDAEGSAGRLYDRLVERYGRQLVFMDFYSIESGEDWQAKITRTVARSAVLLALIGPRWGSVEDESGRRRIEDEEDYLRYEIRTALQNGVRVLPLVVQGARMIGEAQLPEDIADLAGVQAFVLDSRHYDRDVERLCRSIDAIINLGGQIPSLDAEQTAVAGFVGFASRGPTEPTLIRRYTQFSSTFGGPVPDSVLSHCVKGWFANGGESCWIVRVRQEDAPNPSPDAFVGDGRSGLASLESIEDVTIVAAPDVVGLYGSGKYALEDVTAVQLGLIAHCEHMGTRVALLDPLPALTPQQVLAWRQDVVQFSSWRAALYYPWVRVMDPDAGRVISVPPSGHVAGMWAGNDVGDGVWTQPANRPLTGVLDLEARVRRDEREALNRTGINVLIGTERGILAWGARTLSDEPLLSDLATVRLVGSMTALIRRATSWAGFERSNKGTWRRLGATVESVLQTLWQQGALIGENQDDAFFVNCDGEVNPPDLAAAGRIRVEFGFATKAPREFVRMSMEQPNGDWAIYGD